jgi:GT2 family glycosyltransferase
MDAPPITITLTRYAEPDKLLLETLASLAEQRQVDANVLMLDQQDAPDIARFCSENSSAHVRFDYQVIPAKSLSYARNEAIRQCSTDLLLYIDTDAVADPFWAYELSRHMDARQAAIAGGKIIPRWHKAPSFLQRSRVVLDQYSMLDLGDVVVPIKKVIGANFAINKTLLGELAHFDEHLGRQNGKLLGGEETELCARALRQGLAVYYVGSAKVHHQVQPERVTFKWISSRMYYGGYSRALRGGRPEPNNAGQRLTGWDGAALALLLPFYLSGYCVAKSKRLFR